MMSLVEEHSIEPTDDELNIITNQISTINEQSPYVIRDTMMAMIKNHSIDLSKNEMYNISDINNTLCNII